MAKIKIYIAAGWFDEFQEEALDFLETILDNKKFDVYSPRKQIQFTGTEGKERQRYVFEENCKHIQDADIIIASTVGKDMGTLWETGFAYACGIPIVYTFFDRRFKDAKFNLMLAESGQAVFTDKEDFREYIHKLNYNNMYSLKEEWKGQTE